MLQANIIILIDNNSLISSYKIYINVNSISI